MAIAEADTVVVKVVEFTKVADCQVPLTFTVEPETKFVPVTVSVNAVPPAITDVGDIEVRVGAELVTVSVSGELEPPPGVGFVTVTL